MKANVDIFTVSHIIQLSKRLKSVTNNTVTSWASALKLEMQLAEEAMPRTLNEMLLGTGDGLIAALTGSNGASGGATQTLTVGTAANFYQLYPAAPVDVLVRSTLARAAARRRGHDPVRQRGGRHDRRQVRRRLEHVVRGDNTMGLYIEGVAGQTAGSLLAVQGSSRPEP
jgi:hypothetical protein